MKKIKRQLFFKALPLLLICFVGIIVQIEEMIETEPTDIMDNIVVPVIVLAILLGIILVLSYYILSGKCQREIYECMNHSPSPTLEREKIEYFLANAPSLHKFRYDHYYLCGRRGFSTTFMKTNDVVQVCKDTELLRYKIIIPVFKSCKLIFVTKDNQKKSVNFFREKHMDEVISVLKDICPHVQFTK